MSTDIIESFILKAEHDLIVADQTIKSHPTLTDIIAFHCQQTIEKSFKAYLINLKIKTASNHAIIELFRQCLETDDEFNKLNLEVLYRIDDVGMSVRYSDIDPDPGIEEIPSFFETAKICLLLVLKKLAEKGKTINITFPLQP